MSEAIRYIEADGTTTILNVTGNVKYLRGEGADAWEVTPLWDELTGNTDSFAGWDFKRREMALRFSITASSYDNVRGTLAALRRPFLRDVARGTPGTVQVTLDNGGTYSAKAAIAGVAVDGPNYGYADLTIKLATPSMFWDYGATQSTTSAFNGTALVDMTYNNTGEYPTSPTYVITGVAGTPRLTHVRTGHYIEVGTATANAADTLTIYPNPPRIEYCAGGTAAAVYWTGYAGTASIFDDLDVGAGTVRLSAASGTATARLTYTARVAGLGV